MRPIVGTIIANAFLQKLEQGSVRGVQRPKQNFSGAPCVLSCIMRLILDSEVARECGELVVRKLRPCLARKSAGIDPEERFRSSQAVAIACVCDSLSVKKRVADDDHLVEQSVGEERLFCVELLPRDGTLYALTADPVNRLNRGVEGALRVYEHADASRKHPIIEERHADLADVGVVGVRCFDIDGEKRKTVHEWFPGRFARAVPKPEAQSWQRLILRVSLRDVSSKPW